MLEHKKQSPVKYSCSVPVEFCAGTIDARFGGKNANKKVMMLHSSPREATLCHRRYMQGRGYIRIGHAWYKPGEPVHM